METSVKLLNCPFCGGEASIEDARNYEWTVECNKCFAGIEPTGTESEAIAAWNTRTAVPALCDALDVAREEHEAIQAMEQDEVAVPLIQAANRHYWKRIAKILEAKE